MTFGHGMKSFITGIGRKFDLTGGLECVKVSFGIHGLGEPHFGIFDY